MVGCRICFLGIQLESHRKNWKAHSYPAWKITMTSKNTKSKFMHHYRYYRYNVKLIPDGFCDYAYNPHSIKLDFVMEIFSHLCPVVIWLWVGEIWKHYISWPNLNKIALYMVIYLGAPANFMLNLFDESFRKQSTNSVSLMFMNELHISTLPISGFPLLSFIQISIFVPKS